MRAKTNCTLSVNVTMGPKVHEPMLRSGGQSDVKPQVLSSQASFVLIHRSTTSEWDASGLLHGTRRQDESSCAKGAVVAVLQSSTHGAWPYGAATKHELLQIRL
ncbi:hypothetical protein TNCV_1272801 [Trichonephila clavipes]|nr:hypothetical protein TNCV_1272801 [Trichonephila clavipes]